MEARALLKRRSTACPITLLNYLRQAPDSAMPAGASIACPQTQDFGQAAQDYLCNGDISTVALGRNPISIMPRCKFTTRMVRWQEFLSLGKLRGASSYWTLQARQGGCRSWSPKRGAWFCSSIAGIGERFASASWRIIANTIRKSGRRARAWWLFRWIRANHRRPCELSSHCRFRFCAIRNDASSRTGTSTTREKEAASPNQPSS